MKKIMYKFIFSIAFVLVGLFMLPKKEVKALEHEFPAYLIKAKWVSSYYDVENTYSHEFVVTYKIDGLIVENLKRWEYFLISQKYMGIGYGVIDRTVNSIRLEEIQIENNSTIFYVRMTLGKTFVNNYYDGIVENLVDFFKDDSAFYVMYDIFNDNLYNEGFNDGWNSGYEYGRDEGYTDGYNDGYTKGLENGYEVGYEHGEEYGYEYGYDEGYINGRDDGYNNGYNVGYNDGFGDGKIAGYDEGYDDGKADGLAVGREHWYDVGYQAGYNKGINEQLEDKDFSNLLRSAFVAIGAFLGINLLPGISIGAIIAVPIVFGIIAFILGRKKD